MRTRFQLLANPSLRWFVLSCFFTSFAAGVSYLALSWAILKVNDSVAAVSILMLCFWLPNVIFGPWLGVFADKYSRKWLAIAANGIRGMASIIFGVIFHFYVSTTFVYLLMMCLGIGFSLYLPATIALIREIVATEDLLYVNSITNIAYELGFAVGIGIAGFLIAAVSIPVSIWLTGVVFIMSTLAIWQVKLKPLEKNPEIRTVIDDFKVGLHYLYHNKRLIVIYIIQLLLLAAFMTTPILLGPFAKNILHANAAEFGSIEACLSVGIIVGGVLMPGAAERIGLYRSCMVLCFSLAIFFVWFAFNRNMDVARLIYFCLGVSLSVWPLIVTAAQHATDLDFQARVQSVFNSLSGLIVLGIYLLVDAESHFVSIDLLYFLEVFIAGIAILILWRYKKFITE